MTAPPPSETLPGHSHPHTNCPLCDTARDVVLSADEFGALRLAMAAPIWLKEHSADISPKTITDYEYYLRSLTKFFGEMTLREIHPGHIQRYQEWRQTAWKDEHGRAWKAGPSAINHEVNTLAQILQRGHLWKDQKIACAYKPLKAPDSRVGKALIPEEEERLFYVASAGGRWEVAYLAELLSVNTSAGPGEIRHLRMCDIDLARKAPDGTPQPSITIFEGIKNKHRERTIPLNPTAEDCVRRLLKRYQRLLKRQHLEPDRNHYLLPGRARRGRKAVDFMKPQGSWHKAWTAIRERAGLKHIRMYDMRHHVVTKMLENPEISEQTVQETAGHVSKRMKDRYSHIRNARKRDALTSVETKAPAQQLSLSFEPEPFAPAKVLEFMPRVVRKK